MVLIIKCTTNSASIHVLNIHTHTDPVNIEVVENTVYGVRPGTPDTTQRTTTGGIEMKPNLVYGNVAADPGNQTGDKRYKQSSVYDYVP